MRQRRDRRVDHARARARYRCSRAAEHEPLVGERRRIHAGIAPRHAARQRDSHRFAGQGSLQSQQADGRRASSHVRDESTLPAILDALFRDAVNAALPTDVANLAPTNLPRQGSGDDVPDRLHGRESAREGHTVGNDEVEHEDRRRRLRRRRVRSACLGEISAGFPNGRRPGDDVTDIELYALPWGDCVTRHDQWYGHRPRACAIRRTRRSAPCRSRMARLQPRTTTTQCFHTSARRMPARRIFRPWRVSRGEDT